MKKDFVVSSEGYGVCPAVTNGSRHYDVESVHHSLMVAEVGGEHPACCACIHCSLEPEVQESLVVADTAFSEGLWEKVGLV